LIYVLEQAGFNKNYSFVNEPEAILSYWEHMWSDEQSLPKNVDLNNENGFLLVNLKGTVHERNNFIINSHFY
jgi:hypothetical protein